MIVCPNCNHQNPDGATQCEACYTPLPVTTTCPNCGATVQEDASFCGQCGFNLKQETGLPTIAANPVASGVPDLPDPLPATVVSGGVSSESALETSAPEEEAGAPMPPPISTPVSSGDISLEKENLESLPPPPAPAASNAATQLQLEQASLLHVQTNSKIELPSHLSVVHLGKPGGAIPPDIDVSGFPDSAVVSRVHADIRAEGGIYYIEDVGSSNGTYINHTPLPMGNRHRLRPGDRIALGKEDKVTFIFQLS